MDYFTNIYAQFVLVFIALTIIDICWALYISATSDGKAIKAASWSSMIMLFGAFAVTSYIKHPILVIAAAAGAFNGTYWTVRLKKDKEV